MGNALVTTDISQIPHHITKNDYLRLRAEIKEKHYSNGRKAQYYKDRDLLLLDLCWELGGRVGDICRIKAENLDRHKKELKFFTKKRKKWVTVVLTDSLLVDLLNFIQTYKPTKAIIGITRQRAWKIMHKLGEKINLELYPHMFRHGNALFLMGKVPTPVISARLGHANTSITQSMYQKVTPEIQQEFMKEVSFR